MKLIKEYSDIFTTIIVEDFNKSMQNGTYAGQPPDHLLLPHIKLFQKTKIGLELVSLPHFLHIF